MTNEEAIRVLNVAKAECEWNAPLEYQGAFDMAIEALKEQQEHSQNTSSKQPDLNTLGIKTGETCEDVISRQQAVKVILADKIDDKSLKVMTALGDGRFALTLNDACDRHIRDIEKLPSAQPERKMGKWVDKSGGIEGAWNYCSVCGEQAIDLYDFCPNCGADMEETNGKNV